MLINFGQINVLANGLSRSSGSKVEVDIIIVTSSCEDVTLVPNEFVLYQNYPNPFNPDTAIQYELPTYTNVQLKICDIPGNEVRALVNEYQQPGKKIYEWDGKDKSGRVVSSGVYFYQLQTRGFLQTNKLMLLK
jgi:hypothetical protein